MACARAAMVIGRGVIAAALLLAAATPAASIAVHASAARPAASLRASETASGVLPRGSVATAAPLPPTASLRLSTASGTAPLAVTFDGSSSSDPDDAIASWTLDFGDGTVPAQGAGTPPAATPHTYTAPGSYVATVTVTDTGGLTGRATASLAVVTAAPSASLVASPSTDGAPLDVSFDASASSDQDGAIASWTLDFGDGGATASGSGPPPADVEHSYPSPGVYTASLTVADAGGLTATATGGIDVGDTPAGPWPALTASPASGTAPLSVAFNGSASTDPDGSITAWTIDFGDGGPTDSGEGTPPAADAHAYAAAGGYTATLTLTDSNGLTATGTLTVTVVAAAPMASLQASPGSGVAPLSTTFDASASSGQDDAIASWTLDFGDGGAPASGTGAPPAAIAHTYAAAGGDTASLTVTDAGGLTATATVGIAVVAPPPPSPYVSILFARTSWEPTFGSTCSVTDPAAVTLQQAGDWMAAQGRTGTGEVVTSFADRASAYGAPICLGRIQYATWEQLQYLATVDGWDMVSESVDYPTPFQPGERAAKHLAPLNYTTEINGSLDALMAHGFSTAAGLFAYPDNDYVDKAAANSAAVQVDDVAPYYSWGRTYGPGANALGAQAPPYFQHTLSINGGTCFKGTCPQVASHYASPVHVAQEVAAVGSGQWFGVQFYRFITGAGSVTVGTSTYSWDCTNRNWIYHYTWSAEVYCYNDFQSIVRAIPSTALTAGPATVAAAWGLPAH